MRDLALEMYGILAIFAGLVHGVLGETKVFSRARIDPPRAKRLLRAVWQCGAVAWIGGGVLLIAAPSFGSGARHCVIFVFVAVYSSAAIGNAIAISAGWCSRPLLL